MQKTRLIISACLMTLACFSGAHAMEAPEVRENSYRIGCGDVVWISVWQNEKLDKEMIVLPDGTISFPLVGEVMAEGKTVSELKSELIPLLSVFINNPVLTVSVRTVNSMFIYVLGNVNNPGRYSLLGSVDLLQALAIAGGLNAFADKGDIRVFRRQDSDVKPLHFNYRKMIKGQHPEENTLLERGDVIVVP